MADSNITVLLEDGDGDLWVGTGGGLHRFELDTGRFELVPGTSRLSVLDVTEDAHETFLNDGVDTPPPEGLVVLSEHSAASVVLSK